MPDVCSLPTVERPVRLAEFDALFASALRGQERLSPTRLRWRLDPAAEESARALTARESRCCTFFTFTFFLASRTDPGPHPDDGALVLEVAVPDGQVEVLSALAERAAGYGGAP